MIVGLQCSPLALVETISPKARVTSLRGPPAPAGDPPAPCPAGPFSLGNAQLCMACAPTPAPVWVPRPWLSQHHPLALDTELSPSGSFCYRGS